MSTSSTELSPQQFSKFALDIVNLKYAKDLKGGTKEDWAQVAHRVATNVMKAVDAPKELVQRVERAITLREFVPGGRYLAASGMPYHQTQNCLLLRAQDSREGWSEIMHKATQALMTGAGIGVVYGDLREEGAPIRKTGGTATGPLALMQMVNEAGRYIMQGGSRRSAIWAGLLWDHPDTIKFIHIKDWSPEVRALKAKDFLFPATLDGTNISVQLNDEFFEAYSDKKHPKHTLAHTVYWEAVRQMVKKGEPGFSIDIGENAGEDLRNACTEITSKDSDDICNLGSINMARVRDLAHMRELVEVCTAFLLAGTVYSDVPYPDVDKVRTKNRRLGLGLMGLHEWLLKHGKKYGPDAELEEYLKVYRDISTAAAKRYAKEWRLSVPKKVRSIAPNGTISIAAETTGGIEPVFCVSYKRRYHKGQGANAAINYQYVIDPTAARLIESGIPADSIEDAYTLAENVERRVAFQAWVQQFVDHGISSTVNLPAWGTEFNNDKTVRPFGEMLLKHLPKLRGITAYPDGARDGQPLTPVKYNVAMAHLGKVHVEGGTANKVVYEQADACDVRGGGSCGA